MDFKSKWQRWLASPKPLADMLVSLMPATEQQLY
jgi:hypothetical protein